MKLDELLGLNNRIIYLGLFYDKGYLSTKNLMEKYLKFMRVTGEFQPQKHFKI